MSEEPDDWICVEDFCGTFGNIYPYQFWADWSPSRQIVVFGGAWQYVPNLPVDHKPTEEEVHAWVEKFQGG